MLKYGRNEKQKKKQKKNKKKKKKNDVLQFIEHGRHKPFGASLCS